jgi:hypothetical protein
MILDEPAIESCGDHRGIVMALASLVAIRVARRFSVC